MRKRQRASALTGYDRVSETWRRTFPITAQPSSPSLHANPPSQEFQPPSPPVECFQSSPRFVSNKVWPQQTEWCDHRPPVRERTGTLRIWRPGRAGLLAPAVPQAVDCPHWIASVVKRRSGGKQAATGAVTWPKVQVVTRAWTTGCNAGSASILPMRRSLGCAFGMALNTASNGPSSPFWIMAARALAARVRSSSAPFSQRQSSVIGGRASRA